MAEPQEITRSPNLLVTLLSWAEAGAVLEPSSGRKSTGWTPANLVTKEELNWLDREPMRWLRALFSRYLDASELLSSSWFVVNKDTATGIWSDDAVGVLQGFLSDGPAGTASLVTDLWLDPNGTGAVRVQVNVAKAAPATFLANRDTYVFVPIDLVVPPTVSEPELALVDVPVGDPAPAAGAGFVLVWRVETDGAGIVDQEIFLPDFPALKKVSFAELLVDLLTVAGNLDVGGDLSVVGSSSLPTVTGPTTINGSTTIVGGAATAVTASATGSLPTAIIVNTGSGRAQFVQNNDAVNCTLRVENLGASCAIQATSVGAQGTIDAENSGTGPAVTSVNNDAASATMVCVNNGAGPGLAALSDIVVSAGKKVTLTGTAQVLGGATAQLIAGTLDTIDAAGVAKVGELQFYEDTPSVLAGAVQFDGRALALGDGVASPRLAAPLLDTVPTVSSALALADTGAAKALNMRTGEDAKIVITATARNTVIGNNIVFIADAGGASIGNTTSFYEPIAIAAAIQTVTRIIRYTHAGADASVTFKARFGANAGTTHLTDVSIEASHI